MSELIDDLRIYVQGSDIIAKTEANGDIDTYPIDDVAIDLHVNSGIISIYLLSNPREVKKALFSNCNDESGIVLGADADSVKSLLDSMVINQNTSDIAQLQDDLITATIQDGSPIGDVESGNLAAVSGDTVYNEFRKKTSISSSYPFNGNEIVATEVSRAVLDLYLTGIDETLDYDIQYVGKNFSASNLNYFQITQNGVGVASATDGTSWVNTGESGVIEYSLFPLLNSGVTGKVVINWDELSDGVRYNDPYPISKYVSKNLFKKIDNIGNGSNSNKICHFSFDDVIDCLEDITINDGTYTSIFDNSFFSWLKTMNDNYGAVFSLHCFYENLSGFDLSQCTSVFSSEFTENSNWLKFGFHAKNINNSYASTTASQASSDYSQLINELHRITGSVDSLTRVVRLGGYNGNLESCEAMRDSECGIKGLLVSPEVRNNYFLSPEDEVYSNTHATMYDINSKLTFFKTLSTGIDVNFLNQIAGVNYRDVFTTFIHEEELTGGIPSIIESFFIFAKNNDYKFEFLDKITIEK